jgi:hypothetical protein
MSTDRLIVRLVPAGGDWALLFDPFVLRRFKRKAFALFVGTRLARFLGWLRPTQFVCHNADGEIQFEWTYPRRSDPRKYPS